MEANKPGVTRHGRQLQLSDSRREPSERTSAVGHEIYQRRASGLLREPVPDSRFILVKDDSEYVCLLFNQPPTFRQPFASTDDGDYRRAGAR